MSHIWERPPSNHTRRFPLQPSRERTMDRCLKSDLIADQFAAGSLSQSIKLMKLRVKWKVKRVSPRLVPWHVVCLLMWSIWQRSLMASWPRRWLAEWNEPMWAPVWSALDKKKIASSKLHCMATNIDLWPEIYVYMCILSLSLSFSCTSWWTQNRTNSVIWLMAAVTGCASQPSNLSSCLYPLISDALSLSVFPSL